MLVKIIDGKPVEYNVTLLRRDNPQVSFPVLIGPDNLAEFGVYEADIVDAAPTRFHTPGDISAEIVNGRAVVTREWIAPDLASVKALATHELSVRRDAKIEAGFDFNGVTVPCDDKSIGRYTAAYVLARDNPGLTRQWKMPHGFVTLNADQLIALASGAAAFVQSCFDAQAEHLAEIEAAKTVEEIEAILAAAV